MKTNFLSFFHIAIENEGNPLLAHFQEFFSRNIAVDDLSAGSGAVYTTCEESKPLDIFPQHLDNTFVTFERVLGGGFQVGVHCTRRWLCRR